MDSALEFYKVGKANPFQRKTPRRNLVFVALDQSFQSYFDEDLKKIYRTNEQVRVEDLAWWIFAPQLRGIYDQVIRVSYEKFNQETFLAAMDYMESLHTPYDAILLTHGIPNHIFTTKGFPVISWKEVDEWKGRFPSLELLFMQSCYGSSLAPDWLQTGAKVVMSYPGLNRNFFYPMTLLKSLRKNLSRLNEPLQDLSEAERIERIKKAYNLANEKVQHDVKKSALDKFMIQGMGMSVGEYLSQSPNPEMIAQ
jgi:hypothetical protein